MYDVKELIEKTILLVGQANTTCLYDSMKEGSISWAKPCRAPRRLNWLLRRMNLNLRPRAVRTKNCLGLSSTMLWIEKLKAGREPGSCLGT
jgi:hypothetical protein